ncbi:MAG: DUF559 domain-containing protein [Alphaproteobacteria bacterium]|nr:DUF559 domain-containing protein [Alphaproteobacteria bacterium]
MRRRLKVGTIARARQLRDGKPETEGLLWWKLREANRDGYHFRRQVPLHGYFLDFAEHSAKLAIELDGRQHDEAHQRKHDAKRDEVIAKEGYHVLRFWNDEVRRNLDGVVEAILRNVDQRRPRLAQQERH